MRVGLGLVFEYCYEYNRNIFVKFEVEFENFYDKNESVVYIMFLFDYDKVGYLVSELR